MCLCARMAGNFVVLVLLSLCAFCYSYKFLVIFPIPGKSHSILGEGYLRHLINAGHEVTYLTAIPAKISSPKLRNVVLESNVEYFAIDKAFDIAKIINKEIFLNEYGHILDAMFGIANATIFHPKVQELIMDDKENFDAIIAEWMFNDLYSAFSAVFGCPLIWSSSVNAHPMLLSVIDEAPNPAYTADLIQSASVPPFSFVERVEQLWILLRMKYLQCTAVSKRGKSLPSYKAVQYNGSIVLANAHVATGEAMRLPMNHINIGGYHINESSIIPLPQELQSAMDNSKHGVIYFSMGTVLKSRGLPDSIKKGLIKIFSELKYTVIWKFEDKLSDLPKNLYRQVVKELSLIYHDRPVSPGAELVHWVEHVVKTRGALHLRSPALHVPFYQKLYLDLFSEVFGCPLIWFSSMEPHSFLLSLIDDHLSPAYTVFNWDRQYSLDFYGRVKHLYLFLNLIFDKWKLKDIDEIIYRHAYKSAAQSRGRKLSPLHKVKYNASLMLGNSHVSSGESFTLPQSYKPIGGFHIPDEIEPLPKNLQDIMDKSTNGVIYFSLGTILQTHPNTKLFITHGGLLSTFEVLRFGVPIIGIPMFGDQFINVNRAVRKGFAKRFDLGQEPVNVLIDHIKEILRNPSYREKAKELSVAYHDRPVSPGAELVHWVEHVVKTRGAPHLRSPALHVPFYQKLYLDLLVLLLIIFSAFLFVTIRALSLFRNNSSVIEKKIQ
ncbi:unnamed protein product [Leptidea sinapis]|uniref:UDP-glycosyltransferases domain-containing protein n=1 Tax=Leptidea sinapis TaxID=189913 RepID=A0A5E4QWS7_9NEOP|nr:unnamed protein product [Leptidea sinapis]